MHGISNLKQHHSFLINSDKSQTNYFFRQPKKIFNADIFRNLIGSIGRSQIIFKEQDIIGLNLEKINRNFLLRNHSKIIYLRKEAPPSTIRTPPNLCFLVQERKIF